GDKNDMFTKIKIGKRLALAFTVVLMLTVIITISGYWGLFTISTETIDMLRGDAKLAEHSERARANVVGMRRYEKDVFLNIGSEEKKSSYLAQWTTENEHLRERLDDLDKHAFRDEDKNIAKMMHKELSDYENVFNKILN